MTRTFWTLTFTLACLAGPVLAEGGNANRGEELYQDHCATCHGLEMTGHGPMAGVLLVPPTDLTQLSAQDAGVFPIFRVAQRIDGRDPLVAHGSPMPVYGDFFQGRDVMLKTQAGQPIAMAQPVADLIAYLRAHQNEAD